MPLCRATGDGLWELRCRAIASRALFCLAQDHIVVLHGFIKKTQKTPNEKGI